MGFIKHNLNLLRFLKYGEIRDLPWRIKWRFFLLMKNEKLTFLGKKIFINSFLPFYPSQAAGTYSERIKKITKGEFGPQVVILSVTNSCPYKCEFCYNRFFSGQELSLDEIKSALKELEELGAHRVSISGGEPLLRADLAEIIKSISPRSLRLLNTTGYSFTRERAIELKNAGLDVLKISLDDCFKEKVDKLRNFDGAFENAKKAIKLGLEAGLYVVAAKVMDKEMLYSSKLYEFLDFIEGLGAHELVLYEPKPSGGYLNNEKLFSQDDREKLYSLQPEINRDRKRKLKVFVFCYYEHGCRFGCNAGSGYLSIDASGGVSPCAYSGLSLGNIRENSLKEIYSKMHSLMPRPRKYCATIALNGQIKKRFQGKLPLSPEDSREIIATLNQGELPDEYSKFIGK